MKRLIFVLAILMAHYVQAQNADRAAALIKEGIALHDQDKYDAALLKYDSAIALDKENYNAYYEKSLTLLYAKRYDDCIAASTYLLDKFSNHPSIKDVYSNYGSALDDKGDADAAIAIFDKGLQRFPDFYLLHYNKALTLGRQKKWDDAMPHFMNTLQYKPNHAGALYYTSMLLEQENKVAAVLSCLVFLSVEPEGKRAAATYTYLKELLQSFAKKNAEGGSVISVDADGLNNKKKENNFTSVQMMLGLMLSGIQQDSSARKSVADELSEQVNLIATTLSSGIKDGKGIFWKVYAPFIIAMKEKGLVPVYAHIAAITSGDERNIQWINAHQERLVDYKNWMEDYEWVKRK